MPRPRVKLLATIVLSMVAVAGAVSAQRPVFRAAANLIVKDITPRDTRDRFVADLKREEIQVLEDGVEQKVETFQPFIRGGGAATVASPAPAAREGVIYPKTVPRTDRSGRIFIIFIDDLHLDFSLTSKVKEVLQQIRNVLLHDGDLIAVVSSGPSSIEIDQTYDLNRLDEAKRKVMGAGQTPKEIIQMPETSEGPKLLRYNVHVAFDTAYGMLTQLEKVTDRRKSFIYISSGYDFNPLKDSRLQYAEQQWGTGNRASDGRTGFLVDHPIDDDPFSKLGQQFAETDLIQELAALTRAANRANTSFYTIDPRGLMSNLPDIGDQLTAEEWRSFTQVSQSSLRVLADETGGMAVVNRNDIAKALATIDELTSDYYVLAYYSSNPDPLHRLRKIEIRVTRPGVHLMPYANTYSLKTQSAKK